MGEVGAEGRKFHEEIGAYAQERGIELLLTHGELAFYAASAYDAASEHGASAQHFTAIETLNQAVEASVNPDTTVLVKGSRFMRMERVVHHLINQATPGQTQDIH
jgi:UDP-N-acetylmuramoyl-tripeptide--D-alanyl-D-alanine ligase